eukprot:8654659-Ditylum_brightwellii.AAC.1
MFVHVILKTLAPSAISNVECALVGGIKGNPIGDTNGLMEGHFVGNFEGDPIGDVEGKSDGVNC